MADKPKEKTPEELKREVAQKNLKATNLMNVAAAYLVHKSGQWGADGDNAMNEFKYFPAFNSGTKAYAADGTEYDVVKNSILASREDGQLYSGNVSEMKIMKDCAAVMQESLNALTVNDVMGLMGSKAEFKAGFNGKYVRDLMPQLSEEEFAKLPADKKAAIEESMKTYQNLIASYQTYLARTKVSEALAESAKQIPKGLEKILAEPAKPKNRSKIVK